jgi:hypothetical protein
MRWNPFKRLGPPEPKIVVGNIESFHVAPVDSDDPKAVEDAHRMEVEVGRRLEGAHDAKEIRQRIERYEREHGMRRSRRRSSDGRSFRTRRRSSAKDRRVCAASSRSSNGSSPASTTQRS